MRVVIVAAFAALCGCSSQVEQAEKQYAIVKKVGRASDLCAQGRAVVAAYLQAQDTERYSQRQTETAIDCDAAKRDEEIGIFKMPDGSEERIEPDNMDAMADNAHAVL